MKEWLEVKEGREETASNKRRKLRKEQTFIHSPPESPKAEMSIFLPKHSYPESKYETDSKIYYVANCICRAAHSAWMNDRRASSLE